MPPVVSSIREGAMQRLCKDHRKKGWMLSEDRKGRTMG